MESLKQSIEDMNMLFSQQMEAFQRDLAQTSSSSAAVTTSALASEFRTFKEFVIKALDILRNQVNHLAKEQDRQEMRSRRKILLVHGVAEQDTENLSSKVSEVVSINLKLVNFSGADISRCHRLGSLSSKPRPILVKFKDISIRDKVWSNKVSLKGSGITLSEFLTRERHLAFMEARKRHGVSKCWTRDGYVVLIAPDGSKHRLCTMWELDDIPCPSTTAAATKEGNSTAATIVTKAAALKSKRARK